MATTKSELKLGVAQKAVLVSKSRTRREAKNVRRGWMGPEGTTGSRQAMGEDNGSRDRE
jgi:hypothetical protein